MCFDTIGRASTSAKGLSRYGKGMKVTRRIALRFPYASIDGETQQYSNGIIARTEDGHNIIREGEFVLRDNDDLFVPALWNSNEIIAYSRDGYTERSWKLPDDWDGVTKVDIYRITPEGCVPSEKNVSVHDGRLRLALASDAAVAIRHS